MISTKARVLIYTMYAGNGFILFICVSEAVMGIAHKARGDGYIPLGFAKKNIKQPLAARVVQALRVIMS